MPSHGYGTIGLKPAIISELQKDTDENYPGMFLPSALIIMMNEIKRKYYTVGIYNIKIDFSGRYTSLTVRSDFTIFVYTRTKVLNLTVEEDQELFSHPLLPSGVV